jgi:structure-specific endonuclease subunit SLX1
MDPWYVYCLRSSKENTYIGATIDPQRRLRQHNCELVGGARATKARVKAGETWSLFCYVGPFEKIEALRFEWRWKWLSRKATGRPMERRETALNQLLQEKEDQNLSVVFMS